jgi:hypothetical protein
MNGLFLERATIEFVHFGNLSSISNSPPTVVFKPIFHKIRQRLIGWILLTHLQSVAIGILRIRHKTGQLVEGISRRR